MCQAISGPGPCVTRDKTGPAVTLARLGADVYCSNTLWGCQTAAKATDCRECIVFTGLARNPSVFRK